MQKYKKKIICFLVPSHFSGRNGGSEYQVKLIMDTLLNKCKYDIYYLCRYADTNYITPNYRIRKVKSMKVLGRYGFAFDFISLYKELKILNPNIIYQRVSGAYTGIAALYTKNHRAKMIWHIAHDKDVMLPKTFPLKKRIIKYPDLKLREYGIRNADVIIGQTEYQNQLLLKNYGRQCKALIPNGHPIPEKIEKKSDVVCVMWVANLKPMKRPEVFVKLARKLCKVNNLSFIMMGRPDTGKLFRKLLSEINSTANLEYLGEVSNDEVNQRLCVGDILVNTSRHEGFSNTFIQAWMRNVPVVSLNVDPDDVIKKHGLGYHSKTFEQLVKDVESLVNDDKLRESIGNKVQRYAVKNHALNNFDAIIKLIEE